jgi:hypothetical protein
MINDAVGAQHILFLRTRSDVVDDQRLTPAVAFI